jgi:hypothetical protein
MKNGIVTPAMMITASKLNRILKMRFIVFLLLKNTSPFGRGQRVSRAG